MTASQTIVRRCSGCRRALGAAGRLGLALLPILLLATAVHAQGRRDRDGGGWAGRGDSSFRSGGSSDSSRSSSSSRASAPVERSSRSFDSPRVSSPPSSRSYSAPAPRISAPPSSSSRSVAAPTFPRSEAPRISPPAAARTHSAPPPTARTYSPPPSSIRAPSAPPPTARTARGPDVGGTAQQRSAPKSVAVKPTDSPRVSSPPPAGFNRPAGVSKLPEFTPKAPVAGGGSSAAGRGALSPISRLGGSTPAVKPDNGFRGGSERPSIAEIRQRIQQGQAKSLPAPIGKSKPVSTLELPKRPGGQAGVPALKPDVPTAKPGVPALKPSAPIAKPGAPAFKPGAPPSPRPSDLAISRPARTPRPQDIDPKFNRPPSRPTPKDLAQKVQSGKLDHAVNSHVGRQVRLADQYRLHDKGDVARRLNLHAAHAPVHAAHAGHHDHGFAHLPHYPHRGRLHVGFSLGAFHIDYCGPGYFPHRPWYPHWSPWVDWCWGFHVAPYWDPRPLWCRPAPYVVVTTPWVWWQPPVWTPLPVVAAGTWVDVQRPVVPPEQFDLQLLAVRFVDPGHPEQRLGPRYRVWFRNNSAAAVTRPFDVLLFAGGADGQLRGELPRAGVRVPSMEPGQTQSVDIRLPIEALAVGRDPQGKPAPMAVLHALVDANRELSDVDRANNGAAIGREEVLPVDPAVFEVQPGEVAAGGEATLAGEGLGPEPGKVILHVGQLELEAAVIGWYDLGIQFQVPNLPVAGPTKAELIVIRGDGAAANPMELTVLPPDPNAPAAAGPAAAAPAPLAAPNAAPVAPPALAPPIPVPPAP